MPNITIINPDILDDPNDNLILVNGQLMDKYNDSSYNQVLNCKNGYLNIISRNDSNPNGQRLLVQLNGLPSADQLELAVNV